MDVKSLIVGAALTALSFMLKRYISGEKERERASLFLTYTEIAAKLNESSLTMVQVENLAAAIEGKRRQEEILIDIHLKSKPYLDLNQTAMNERAAKAANLADLQLRIALFDLSQILSEDEVAALNAAQSAWDAFRASHVDFSGLEFAGGSLEPLVRNTEHEAVALQRIALLKAVMEERKVRMASDL